MNQSYKVWFQRRYEHISGKAFDGAKLPPLALPNLKAGTIIKPVTTIRAKRNLTPVEKKPFLKRGEGVNTAKRNLRQEPPSKPRFY